MSLGDTDVAPLTVLLSAERLAAFQQLAGSARTAIELHQETLQLNAALMMVTATIEIALRNTVAECLSQHFGVPDWLQRPPIGFRWRAPELQKIRNAVISVQRHAYSRLNQNQKAALDAKAFPLGRPPNMSHADRYKARKKLLQISEGQIIAELTLGFWKTLYGPDYEHWLWKTALKKTFPDVTVSRSVVAVELEKIYQSRNRVAHHEPVLHRRFADTMGAIDFIVQRLGAPSPSAHTPLAHLLAEDIALVHARAAALHARLASSRVAAS